MIAAPATSVSSVSAVANASAPRGSRLGFVLLRESTFRFPVEPIVATGKINYPLPMLVRQTFILYCLLVALPMSSWAGSAMSCARDSIPASGQSATVDAHSAHQGHQAMEDDTSPGNAASQSAMPSDPLAVEECPCCDGCSYTCAASSCSGAVAVSFSQLLIPRAANSIRTGTDMIRATPAINLLFRPPITSLI